MVIVGPDGIVRPIRPQFHATLYASLDTITAVFGKPDLHAASIWFITVDRPGSERGRQLILVPDLAASGFDPAGEPGRSAAWVLVSDSTQRGDPAGLLAPVLAPVMAAVSARVLSTRPKPRALASIGRAGGEDAGFADDDGDTLAARLAAAFEGFGTGGNVDEVAGRHRPAGVDG